ncbi:MAG: class I SAM-dependent methyltransferase [Chloroflexia bacterium]|nr:class I SAM-dependent methyltransferase [Chloroflexia bacterium]
MTYARLAMADEELKQKLREAFLSQLPWDGQGKALDVGTGAGLMAIGLARRNPQAQVIGVDVWEGPIWGEKGVGFSQARCEQNAIAEGVTDRVRFEHASAIDLPYADGEFDAVMSSYVFHEIHQVKDKRVLLGEALRVLRPGGAFAFLDPFQSKAYGGPQALLIDLRTKGLSSVDYVDLADLGTIPPLLQLITHGSGILYGVK